MPRRKTVAELRAQLEALDRKARERKARIQQKAAEQKKALKDKLKREASAEKRAERKRDTRRKILVGALVLERMSNNSDYHRRVMGLLDERLTRPGDRALFGLPLRDAAEK